MKDLMQRGINIETLLKIAGVSTVNTEEEQKPFMCIWKGATTEKGIFGYINAGCYDCNGLNANCEEYQILLK